MTEEWTLWFRNPGYDGYCSSMWRRDSSGTQTLIHVREAAINKNNPRLETLTLPPGETPERGMINPKKEQG